MLMMLDDEVEVLDDIMKLDFGQKIKLYVLLYELDELDECDDLAELELADVTDEQVVYATELIAVLFADDEVDDIYFVVDVGEALDDDEGEVYIMLIKIFLIDEITTDFEDELADEFPPT